MITIRQMSYFDALARHLHFGQAAKAVHVTQPALSAQIAEMERRLGRKLVERRRGAIVLTETGRALLPLVRDVLERARRIDDLVLAGEDGLSGQVQLGMIPTVAPYLLPLLLPVIQKRFPDIEVKVREAVTEQLLADLADGALDAVVAAQPINDSHLRSAHLFRDRFFIASSPRGRDVIASPMTQDSVIVERLLLLEEGHCLRDQALAVCTAAQGKRLLNFGATSMTTLLQMVAHGMGLTLLPEIAIATEARGNGDIAITPFAAPVPYRDIALFWRRSSEQIARFEGIADCAREAAEPLLQSGA